jgi:hypothetical protein
VEVTTTTTLRSIQALLPIMEAPTTMDTMDTMLLNNNHPTDQSITLSAMGLTLDNMLPMIIESEVTMH